jgi:hypothetical protein
MIYISNILLKPCQNDFLFTKPEGVYLKPRMICCGLVELVLFKLVSTPWRRLCDIVPGTESAQTGCKGMVM